MRANPLLIVLALASALFATAAQAYDNCDSLRYNDRAYQACVNNAYGGNARTSPSTIPIYGPTEEEQETERKRLQREAFERNESYEDRMLRLRTEREAAERHHQETAERDAQQRKWREESEAKKSRTEAERYYRAAQRVEDAKTSLAGKPTWSVSDYVYIMDVSVPGATMMEYYARDGYRVHGKDMALYYAVSLHLGVPYGNPASIEYKENSMKILEWVFESNNRLDQVRACALFNQWGGKDQRALKKGLRLCRKAFRDMDESIYEAFWKKLRDSVEYRYYGIKYPFREENNDQYERWYLIRHPAWKEVLATGFSDTSLIGLMLSDIAHCTNELYKGNYCSVGANFYFDKSSIVAKQGSALYADGKFAEAAGQYREALRLLQHMADSPGFDKEHMELAYRNLGLSLLAAAEYAEAESMFKQALALRDNEPTLKPDMQFYGSREERLVRDLKALAGLYSGRQKHFEANPYLRRIFELQEKTRGAEHLETLASLRALAENLSAQGSDKEAVLHWQRTVSLAEKLPAAHSQLPELRENLLIAYNRSGAFPKEAEALEIQIDWKTPWRRLVNAASAAYKAGQYEEAINQSQKALDFAEKHGGPQEIRVGISQNNLAVHYRAVRQYKQAEALYKKALDTYASANGADSPSLILPLRELSSLYDLLRRFDEAEPLYRRLLVLQERKLGLEHVDVAKTLSNLARLHDRKNQYTEAEPLFTRALAIIDKRGETDDESLLLDILPGLARAYRNTGRDDEARRVDQRYEKLRDKIMKGDLSGPFHPAWHLKLALS